jgi:hypothetical protein
VGAGSEERRISTVAAVIITVGLGVVMAYFGVLLAGFGVYAISQGEALLGILALVFGVVLVSIPVAILFSQLRAMLRRRG